MNASICFHGVRNHVWTRKEIPATDDMGSYTVQTLTAYFEDGTYVSVDLFSAIGETNARNN